MASYRASAGGLIGVRVLISFVFLPLQKPWWRYHMETFSALLAICAGNSQVTGEFPAQRPVTRRFDFFICARMNCWVNNREAGDLRLHCAHCDVTVIVVCKHDVHFKCCSSCHYLAAKVVHSDYKNSDQNQNFIILKLVGYWSQNDYTILFRTPEIICLVLYILSVAPIKWRYYVFDTCHQMICTRGDWLSYDSWSLSEAAQIAKLMGPTWGPPGSWRPQMGPMLAPWTLLSGGLWTNYSRRVWCEYAAKSDRGLSGRDWIAPVLYFM